MMKYGKEKIRKFPIGGTHLPEEKDLTSGIPIVVMPPPRKITVPLKQHIGIPVEPAVKPGDRVRRGEVIGRTAEHLHAKVHSGITGTVTGVTTCRMPEGSTVPAVEIERRGDDTGIGQEEFLLPPVNLEGLEDWDYAEAVRARVKEAGIVGLGGAGFPTHVKLIVKDPVDTIIINGAECEPYITVDDRLMQEQADRVMRGLDIIRRTVGASKGFAACEINKPEALARLKEAARDYPELEAVALDTRYPHGAEKHLVKAVLDREIPLRSLPGAVGVLVNNVQTAIAIADAIDHGRTLHSRVLTVSGHGIKSPKNLLVPIGTSIGEIIDFCGGETEPGTAVIVGGPMTGSRISDLSIPVVKATSGIILLTAREYGSGQPSACIRCGKCVEVCPMYLPPNRITAYVNADMIEEAAEAGLEDCILCGACQYVCPSKRPLLSWIKQGKALKAKI